MVTGSTIAEHYEEVVMPKAGTWKDREHSLTAPAHGGPIRLLALTVLSVSCSISVVQPLGAQDRGFPEWWGTYLHQSIGASAAGYAWVVLQRGAVLAQGGAGYERVDTTGVTGTPMTPVTRMQIASASKPITAMALQLLADERGIPLDTPMVELIPRFAPTPGAGVERITLRHLLQHRSGYPFGYVWPPRADSLRALLARNLPNLPGERARYSNINYSLARTVIEEVSGQSYSEFVQERMLEPTGITGATLVNQPGDAFAHRFDSPVRGRELVWDFNDDAGGYGWYMSAMNLARWGEALLQGTVVPMAVVRQALTDSLGWGHASTVAGTAYVHQGQWIIAQNMGVRTAIAVLPDSVVAVLFVNTNVPYSPTTLLLRAFNVSVPTVERTTDAARGTATVHLTIPPFVEEVRYTVDGREPTRDSPRYEAPISVTLPARIRAQGFKRGEAWGFEGTVTLEEPGRNDNSSARPSSAVAVPPHAEVQPAWCGG